VPVAAPTCSLWCTVHPCLYLFPGGALPPPSPLLVLLTALLPPGLYLTVEQFQELKAVLPALDALVKDALASTGSRPWRQPDDEQGGGVEPAGPQPTPPPPPPPSSDTATGRDDGGAQGRGGGADVPPF